MTAVSTTSRAHPGALETSQEDRMADTPAAAGGVKPFAQFLQEQRRGVMHTELGLAPFVGEDAYRISARLRYRIRGGDLLLGYRLDRPADVLRDAVDGIADRLGQRFTLDRVFVGRPR
jgi:hypothetical protein